MKRTIKYAAVVVGIPTALITAVIIWKANFFLLPFATIKENGHTASGYVYTPLVSDCEEWTAAYLPLFMFPDVNPPCIEWYAAEEVPPPPKAPKRDVKVKERSVEFTANDGKRVTVRW